MEVTGLPPLAGPGQAFALLDEIDAAAPGAGAGGRLYTGWVREHRCTDPLQLDACWAAVQADQARGLHAVMLADYEWGARLQQAGHAPWPGQPEPALRLLMFRRLDGLSGTQAQAWLRAMDGGQDMPGAAGVMALQADETEARFHDTIGRIHAAIRAGETYQVNHTFRLSGQAWGEPVSLYRRLRARQSVAYGALIAWPDEATGGALRHVLSLSPELFLQALDGQVTARPMKGTAARQADPAADAAAAKALAADVKNRAENLMIVDLLRNDLGRVAETGSVRVPRIFEVEPYATLHQMTSTVEARLRPEVDLPALLRASFPCGSITGAPKHRTMGWIRELEHAPRGLYCGAIGWIDAAPVGRKMGDACWSVAIRTLTLAPPPRGDASRPLHLGVGAGIVLDSVAADEWAECRLKARFLTGLDPGVGLIETLRVEAQQAPMLAAHLRRLRRSAAVLGFAFDGAAIEAALQSMLPGLPALPHRLRLLLRHDGDFELTHAPLPPLALKADGKVELIDAAQPLPAAPHPLATHKSTLRAHYDAGVREAEAVGAFDSLFFREDGRLLEGGRSSVFVKLDGRWLTPPLADGVLAGVMREHLLADPAWQARECALTRADLDRAEDLVVCNALRGVLPARRRAV